MSIKVTSSLPNQGLDVIGKVPWQMVPVFGSRSLTVSGTAGLTPRARDPKILKITVSGPTLKLEGLAEGLTHVDWVSSATAIVKAGFTLEVSVKKKKIVRTAFHYVDDGRKQITARKQINIQTLINVANNILTPQTNVSIDSKSAKVLKIKQNLGGVVRFSSHLKGVAKKEHEWDNLRAFRDITADFNVFFVVAYEQDATPLKDNANAGTIASHKMCVMEDNPVVASSGRTLAHETVHLLSTTPHTSKGMMGPAGAGTKLDRKQANAINPSGAK